MPLLNPDEVYKAALRQYQAALRQEAKLNQERLPEQGWAQRAKIARMAEQVKALEQFQRLAEQAHVTPEMLAPEPSWPFPLTQDDKDFLRSLPYPISPA